MTAKKNSNESEKLWKMEKDEEAMQKNQRSCRRWRMLRKDWMKMKLTWSCVPSYKRATQYKRKKYD